MDSISPDFLITTLYFGITLALSQILRILGHILLECIHPLLNRAFQEALAAFELCVICYEISILLDYPFGVWWYALYLFLASTWWDLFWTNATSAPYTVIVDWIYGLTSTVHLLVIVAAQILGGSIFYEYWIKPMWSLGFGTLHLERVASIEICLTDIQAPVIVAAIVEGSGVFLCLITGKLASNWLNTIPSAVVDAFISTSLVIAAMNISGGYYNSVLATSTLWGCFGSTPLEHFMVYWVGETIGAIVAEIFWQTTLKQLLGSKSKSD